ncbi:MAG: radical SAM protein [Thiobacillus sp.]
MIHPSYDTEPGCLPPEIYIPATLDIEYTARCEYSCPGCWGTKPNNERELALGDWMGIVNKLDRIDTPDFTSRVIVTGGEPLLRTDVDKFINFASDKGKEVTLSTTGLDRHDLLPGIIPKLSAIGIPIDGPSAEVHASWRHHPNFSDAGLSIAINALRMVQDKRPDLKTTVRTLIHSENIDHLTEIPSFLEKSGIDTSRLRWTLYEKNYRRTGKKDNAIYSSRVISSRYGDPKEFDNKIVAAGESFNEVLIREIGNLASRYTIISPTGECRLVIQNEDDDYLTEMYIGNIVNDFDEVIQTFNDLIQTDFATFAALSSSAGSILADY